MLVTLISWLIMLFVFGTIGIGVNSIINKGYSNNRSSSYDIIWYGIVCITVYAQLCSLFGPVGKQTVIVILIFVSIIAYSCREQYAEIKDNVCDKLMLKKGVNYLWIIVGGFILIVGLVFTVQVAGHYDTNLYHAQNIRWIEEYGIVKGLGNLHNRFAYNSAFMCLQALFSFVWCTKQSLHTLNGFLWVFMMSYSAGTLKVFKEKKIFLSDLFKILMLFYLCNDIVMYNLSSPHTDMMTLSMVLYIVIRWNELLEDNYHGYVMYGILCLLGVCAVSVKLSAAMVLILVLKPAIAILREKKWNIIAVFIGIGLLIIIPFLARNVILSGYLVYPYAGIDIFNVDWKMSKALVTYDNQEIVAWGRMLNDPAKFDEPITTWLPIWLDSVEHIYSLLMIFNMFLIPVSIIGVIYRLWKKQFDQCLMLLCVEILYLGWLLTAPLPRYGLVYLFVTPIYYLAIVLGYMFKQCNRQNIVKAMYIIFILLMAVKPGWRTLKNVGVTLQKYVIMPADYNNNYETYSVEWEGMDIYIPLEGDQGTYIDFPSTPSVSRLEEIELRENELSGGFKLRGK